LNPTLLKRKKDESKKNENIEQTQEEESNAYSLVVYAVR
jgi:hypothetical protein